MSPYDLIDIFVRQKKLFATLCACGVLASVGFLLFQPQRYRGEVVLTVTRTALADSAEYTYDEYYRLEADAKLADTVVQYLKSTTGKQMIAERAKLSEESYQRFTHDTLRIARLGTQLILTEYTLPNREEAVRLGEALAFVANRYVASLSEDARDLTWFTVLAEDPVVREAQWSALHVMGIGVFGGVFLAFWGVLVRVFSEGYRRHRDA